MVSAQYLRGGRGDVLTGRPKNLGGGGNENLYPPLVLSARCVCSSTIHVPSIQMTTGNNYTLPQHTQRWRNVMSQANSLQTFGNIVRFVFSISGGDWVF